MVAAGRRPLQFAQNRKERSADATHQRPRLRFVAAPERGPGPPALRGGQDWPLGYGFISRLKDSFEHPHGVVLFPMSASGVLMSKSHPPFCFAGGMLRISGPEERSAFSGPPRKEGPPLSKTDNRPLLSRASAQARDSHEEAKRRRLADGSSQSGESRLTLVPCERRREHPIRLAVGKRPWSI